MSAAATLFVIQMVVFIITVVLFMSVGMWAFGANRTVKRRLQEVSGQRTDPKEGVQQGAFYVHWDKPAMPVRLPVPGWEESRYRQKLVYAGIRSDKSLRILLASKIILAFVLPTLFVVPMAVLGWFQGNLMMGVWTMVFMALMGFFIPDMYLSHKISERRQFISESFPDVLDLLVVCVEAGLGLDAAIQRVAGEVRRSCDAMADELLLVTLEMRSGKNRQDALMALAERTGLKDIQSLVSILIQAENFGTSVGEALREHSEEMRDIRIQRAREKAAKLPVRLTFPILIFIFPALFLVILGPAIINIFTGLGGALGNG